ncbi:PREDICTED: E3 ubiquitin-protein ligase RNF135 isoform X1 [Gavialis gangeticus]|uniref:E3 ubiquitin-protein ligase RNF135 isoform X1 n=2 Tax=Gavialis gangeticus TaxID=94835 RepID=UPI00092F297D|nr:PREDICTED: E3 ubiquitin-protein ligase RNF135 isoform X1 [Gavialis gangeticus]
MAAANLVKNLQEEVTCSLCLDYFKDPVIIIKCSHSFCRDCIGKHYKEVGTDVKCPHCMQIFQWKDLTAIRQLANIVEIIQKMGRETEEMSEISRHIEMVKDAIHSREKDMDEINENLSQIKGLITEDFGAMKERLAQEERETLRIIAQEQQTAQQKTEEIIGQLTSELNKLTEIKTQMERGANNSLLKQLNFEGEICTGSCVTLNGEKIVAVTSAVEQFRKQLESMLERYPRQLPSEFDSAKYQAAPKVQPGDLLAETSVASSCPEPADSSPDPIISSQFALWAENVTFDLERIHHQLEVKDENRKVIVSLYPPRYKDSPNRFRISQVMCSQSFSSGFHYWEIITKDSAGWAVGIADRKIGSGERLGRTELSWCVEWTNGQLSAWHRNQKTPLKEGKPLRVGVFLNLSDKNLSFYSLAKEETCLHTFEINILEPVYPAFWMYGLDENGSLSINHIKKE